jgi:hypothetical protein
MAELSNNEIYLIQSHLWLLECTLATYEDLCHKSKLPKREIDRHESIIKNALHNIGRDAIAVRQNHASMFPAEWRNLGRVDEILGYVAKEDYGAGIQRYFNRIRYGVGNKP